MSDVEFSGKRLTETPVKNAPNNHEPSPSIGESLGDLVKGNLEGKLSTSIIEHKGLPKAIAEATEGLFEDTDDTSSIQRQIAFEDNYTQSPEEKPKLVIEPIMGGDRLRIKSDSTKIHNDGSSTTTYTRIEIGTGAKPGQLVTVKEVSDYNCTSDDKHGYDSKEHHEEAIFYDENGEETHRHNDDEIKGSFVFGSDGRVWSLREPQLRQTDTPHLSPETPPKINPESSSSATVINDADLEKAMDISWQRERRDAAEGRTAAEARELAAELGIQPSPKQETPTNKEKGGLFSRFRKK